MNALAHHDFEDLQALTARYARYSRSAGGLSNVFGAVLVTAAFAVAAFLPLPPALRIVLALTPFAWLASEGLLRRFYYQRYGGVAQQVSPPCGASVAGWSDTCWRSPSSSWVASS